MKEKEMDELEKEALETLSKLQAEPQRFAEQYRHVMHQAAAETLNHVRAWRLPY